MSSRKSSVIWEYFTVDGTKESIAVCKICNIKLCRGSSAKAYSTSPLIQHLRAKHASEFKAYTDGSNAKAESKATLSQLAASSASPTTSSSQPHCQLSLAESWQRVKLWDIKSSEAQRIHKAIGRMIVKDMEPFQVVEKEGFVDLMNTVEKRYTVPSRKFFAERVIPDMYAQVEKSLSEILQEAGNISFTCDTWTTDNTVQSFFGITAHWLSDDFCRHSYVLQCMPLNERHTGQHLGSQFEVTSDRWHINKERCHLVVRDNAANMVKCFKDLGIPSIGCFAHTIQLAVSDSIMSQKYVTDIIATCRKIVGHFRHSSTAMSRLHEFQARLSLPNHQLIQDVSTRWNSSFYMMQRLLEQRQALALYAAESESLVGSLSPNQWDVLKNAVSLLEPFEEATKYVSLASSCTSDTIPILAGLKKRLQTTNNDAGVKTMKAALLDALCSRFQVVEENPVYTLASLLDPRYKTRFFSPVLCETVIGEAKAKLAALCSVCATAATRQPEDEPVRKKARQGESTSITLFDCVDDLLTSENNQSQCLTPDATVPNAGILELDCYLAEPLIPRTSDMLIWWQQNTGRFPLLSSMARTYLGPPASSVPSERLFSTAGGVITEHRSRLLPDNAEKLIFMKFNAKLIKS